MHPSVGVAIAILAREISIVVAEDLGCKAIIICFGYRPAVCREGDPCPTSHRQVDYTDPTIALEVVLFADLLLRMLDERATTAE
jgi:hypothetical protein